MSLKIRDGITPDLNRIVAALKDKKPVLQAMGQEIVNITKRAFRDASLRATPWPLKKDGKVATLRKDGPLQQSPRIVEITDNTVTTGSDRPYAMIQQLGGKTKAHVIKPKYAGALYWDSLGHPVKEVHHPGSKIPPRPFFPFRADGTPTPQARESLDNVVKAKVDSILGH